MIATNPEVEGYGTRWLTGPATSAVPGILFDFNFCARSHACSADCPTDTLINHFCLDLCGRRDKIFLSKESVDENAH